MLPVGVRPARFLVLTAVFVCAACGLVYELALIALGSYLVGDTVGQASVVLAVMVFAMGVGSLLAKRWQPRAAAAFAAVELALALLGGVSVLVLYAAFAWLKLYSPALVVVSFLVGLLIGAEIPLLMTLLQRIRRQDAGSAVADLFAADYVGALLGGLAFPFLLLPLFGHMRGALLVGVVNALAGSLVVLWLFRADLGRRLRLALGAATVVVVAVLAGVLALVGPFEVVARQALYRDPVVLSERTPYQQIVVTRGLTLTRQPELRLYLNGDLQFSSTDEYRYHEALVHPAMAGPHERVLVLGGGDGLAAREVLEHGSVRSLTQVELDPAMVRLAREWEPLRSLNGDSLSDPRVTVRTADAFTWLREPRGPYDVVVIDMPDPDAVATAKLYSVEFYGLVRRALAPGGRVVVQAGSTSFAPRTFACIEAGMRAAGLQTRPYHVNVPSFGDWGYLLASAEAVPELRLPDGGPSLRSLDEATLQAAGVFAPDRVVEDAEPSTLDRPRILDLVRTEWRTR
ncbi:polyamine aminopropyltransferase [Kineococcus xinjiangensis]|uniref:polyamine aminopropyltransferase n=1 Tax=Kineococcus xinjiangensis TaxID=512762 RepID=UPI000CECBB54